MDTYVRTTPRLRHVLALSIATWVLAGCASDTTADGGPRTASPSPGQASAAIEATDAALCTWLDDLEGSLDTVTSEGLAQGDEVISRLDAASTALRSSAAALEAAGRSEVAASATSLASDVEELTAREGEEARAAAAEASVKLDELSADIDCS